MNKLYIIFIAKGKNTGIENASLPDESYLTVKE